MKCHLRAQQGMMGVSELLVHSPRDEAVVMGTIKVLLPHPLMKDMGPHILKSTDLPDGTTETVHQTRAAIVPTRVWIVKTIECMLIRLEKVNQDSIGPHLTVRTLNTGRYRRLIKIRTTDALTRLLLILIFHQVLGDVAVVFLEATSMAHPLL